MADILTKDQEDFCGDCQSWILWRVTSMGASLHRCGLGIKPRIYRQRLTCRWKSLTPDCPEVKDGAVSDYLAGNKVVVIQDRYGISPGELYRVLHRAGVKLRTKG